MRSVRLGVSAVIVPLCVFVCSVVVTGCSTIKENAPDTSQLSTTTMGAATGAVLGGGLGAVMGSVSGDAGTGLVIGTLAGTAAGGLVGAAIENQQDNLTAQKETVQKQEEQIGQNRRQIEDMRRDLSKSEARANAAKSENRPAAAALPDARASFRADPNQSLTRSTSGYRNAQPYQPSAEDLARAQSTNEMREPITSAVVRSRGASVRTAERQAAVAKRIEADVPPVVVASRPTARGAISSGAATPPSTIERMKPVEPIKVIEPANIERAKTSAVPSNSGASLPAASLPKAKQTSADDVNEEALVEEDGPDSDEAAVPAPVASNNSKANHAATSVASPAAGLAATPSVARAGEKATAKTGEKLATTTSALLPADKSCQEAGQEAQRGLAAASDADKLFYLRRAIRLCPTHVPFHIQVGGIYESIGRKEDAAYEFRQVLDLDPQNSEAKNRLQSLDGTKTAAASE